VLADVVTFGFLPQNFVGYIDTGVPENAQHADGWVVIGTRGLI